MSQGGALSLVSPVSQIFRRKKNLCTLAKPTYLSPTCAGMSCTRRVTTQRASCPFAPACRKPAGCKILSNNFKHQGIRTRLDFLAPDCWPHMCKQVAQDCGQQNWKIWGKTGARFCVLPNSDEERGIQARKPSCPCKRNPLKRNVYASTTSIIIFLPAVETGGFATM